MKFSYLAMCLLASSSAFARPAEWVEENGTTPKLWQVPSSVPRSPDLYGHSPNEPTTTDPESCRTAPYDACDREIPRYNDHITSGEPSRVREQRSPPPPFKRDMLRPPVITLPAEKDGVLPDGTVINAIPDSPTNPQSCWTKPVDPIILGIDSNFASGLCQVCVIQNGTDAEVSYPSSYEIWVRDDDNHAIGGAGPLALSPLDGRPGAPYYINFTTAGKPFNMWSQLAAEDPNYSVVSMAWNIPLPANPKDTSVMQFDSYPDPKTQIAKSGNNCRPSGSTDDGVVVYFQCWFLCW